MKIKLLIIALICFAQVIKASANTSRPDSTGVEIKDGKKIVLHKVAPKENYFSIGRRYKVSPKAIISYNNNIKLTPGTIIKVPLDQTSTVNTTPAPQPLNPSVQKKMVVYNTPTVQYKVVAGETLYSISRRFNTKVADIVSANGLKSDKVVPGQLLNIPGHEAQTPVVATATESNTVSTPKAGSANQPQIALYHPNSRSGAATTTTVVQPVTEQIIEKPEAGEVAKPIAKSDSTIVAAPADSADAGQHIPANKFGLYEKTEKGVGVWMNNDSLDPSKKLILHRTAPVGTVIKITNPMTNRTTFAKVVGRFTENSNTKDVVIVMTKSVAEALGALDQRFHVILSYGSPNE